MQRDARKHLDSRSVVDRLRADVLVGRLTPGERLLETGLAEEYGCSHASMRAAILQPASEGIVEREANRGASSTTSATARRIIGPSRADGR